MKNKVLICDPDSRWEQNIFNILIDGGNEPSIASNGKEAQLILSEQDYDAVIIDLDTKIYSAIQVIKFIQSQNLHIHIILTAESQKKIDEYFFSPKDLDRLGLAGVIIKPFPAAKLLKLIDSFSVNQSWREIELNPNPDYEEVEVKDLDDSFTSIKSSEFFTGNMSIFDLHVKLEQNNYLKFLKAGDKINQKKLNEIIDKYDAEYFYFKTKERMQYINFLNETIEKVKQSRKIKLDKKVSLIKNVSEKFIEEVYTKGINQDLLDEGMHICDNTYDTINNNNELVRLFRQYTDYDESIASHLFLVGLFSSIICKKIDWITKRSAPMVMLGSFLHDIGKIKLPSHIVTMKSYDLDEENYKIYMQHPLLGAKLLEGVDGITEQIIQIVYQHHERNKSNGFPMGLTSAKIFPLAKIIGFSDMVATRVVREQKNPFDTMKILISEGDDICEYDATIVKAFLRSFVENE